MSMFEKELLLAENFARDIDGGDTGIANETVHLIYGAVKTFEQSGTLPESDIVNIITKVMQLGEVISSEAERGGICRRVFLLAAIGNLGYAVAAYATASVVESISDSINNVELNERITEAKSPSMKRYLTQKYYFITVPDERSRNCQERIDAFWRAYGTVREIDNLRLCLR